ncbi:MTMR3-like protein [Mya arenaria]|uniref:phosphatidylinositol-3,5-bisphosphate 3-phosphatase n=1 Tax=Mya arenaria TaxID=6604 RepID=A0ABY7E6J0_MYAAR|nr:MTMR3-like protein [Mya arenaria]
MGGGPTLLPVLVTTVDTGVEQEPMSLEHIRRSDVFPKKVLVSEDDALRVPFPVLSGEAAEYLGRTADGIIVLSNYRILIRYQDSFINLPLGLIEGVDMRDIFYLHIYSKDGSVVRCSFSTNDMCQDWFRRVQIKIEPVKKLEDVFAFCFYAWCADHLATPASCSSTGECFQLCPTGEGSPYSFTGEMERMGFKLDTAWRYTDINNNFSLCSSYPTEHIVPHGVKDDNLKAVAGFRALRRFPTVVWRNQRNGAVLVRAGQPEMGIFGWRNTDDENLLNAIPAACTQNPGNKNRASRSPSREDGSGSDISGSDDSSIAEGGEEESEPRKMLIIDCRSYSAAMANRAKGGGMECPEYYQNCEIQFMALANIHAVRKSFLALRSLCNSVLDQASWLSGLENTKWMQHMSGLLKTAVLVVSANEKEGRPVLVHCSDGWDRTPQVISLAEIMLDPYYRTVEIQLFNIMHFFKCFLENMYVSVMLMLGFQVLIEREWLQFGHKFADRCGNGVHTDDLNERCPVFLQWLECVYQLLVQFPCQFQFTEAFLVKLVQHTYSCLFGTFLCNTLRERQANKLSENTASIWALLSLNNFHNQLYTPTHEHEVLYPAIHMQNLRLWTSVYLSNNLQSAGPEDSGTQTGQLDDATTDPPPSLQKTRSCENLLTGSTEELNTSLSRRRSDPNLAAMDHCDQKLLKDAIGGDTSCSSESMKSSDNDRSLAETCDLPLNGVHHGNFHDANEETPKNGDVEENNKENDGINGFCDTSYNKLENGYSKELHNGAVKNETRDNDSSVSNYVGKLNGIGFTEHAKSIVNGIDSEHMEINIANGNGIHEMNGHSNGSVDSGPHSPDSVNDSSENSIETISECEDADPVTNGANSIVYEHTVLRPVSENSVSTSYSNGDNPDIDKRTIVKKLQQRRLQCDGVSVSLESSTDTVTEEVQTGDSSHTLTPSSSTGQAHSPKAALAISPSATPHTVASLQSLCDHVATNTLKSLENTTSISTSTSDLTDSRVHEKLISNCSQREILLNKVEVNKTSLNLRCYLSQTTALSKSSNGVLFRRGLDGGMVSPLGPAPVSPQSLVSTCPPTPGTSDTRSLDAHMPRHGLSRHLDVDGLTKFVDPVQKQISSIKDKYEQQIAGELASIQSNYSNAASDASWDQMDDPEVNMTRWVPDHSVTHCAGCDTQFTWRIRRHHCRNCGKIFCDSCSAEKAPLPHQMIVTEERVCQHCYKKISSQLTKSIVAVDELTSLGAAASN